jgi:DNA-binding MarR family transcriptional regulator
VNGVAEPDYGQLLAFRTALRRFLKWSEAQAKVLGLTPAQHQLLLAVKGHEDARGPLVGDLAESLVLRHHSTVELIDRAEEAGYVARAGDETDRRAVRVHLTPEGERLLRQLTEVHVRELKRLGPLIRRLADNDD